VLRLRSAQTPKRCACAAPARAAGSSGGA